MRHVRVARYNACALEHSDMMHKEGTLSARLSARDLRGILIPFVTPFREDGEVDPQGLSANIEGWSRTGVRGYVALGSTGERVHLGEDEALRVIETARRSVPSTQAFIVGAGRQSVRLTIKEARTFAGAGADALLVITPGYYRAEMSQAALADYYRAVADASPVPLLLYSIPQLTGVSLQPDTVARLAEHQNIVGIKDSSGDMVALGEMLRLVPDGFAVMTGHGAALFPALALGACGAILAVACFASRATVEIYDAFQSGDHSRALSLQRRVALLVRGVMARYGIGGIKAAMDALGLAGGRVRAPLPMPEEEARLEIKRLLRESELFGEELGGALDEEEQSYGAGAV